MFSGFQSGFQSSPSVTSSPKVSSPKKLLAKGVPFEQRVVKDAQKLMKTVSHTMNEGKFKNIQVKPKKLTQKQISKGVEQYSSNSASPISASSLYKNLYDLKVTNQVDCYGNPLQLVYSTVFQAAGNPDLIASFIAQSFKSGLSPLENDTIHILARHAVLDPLVFTKNDVDLSSDGSKIVLTEPNSPVYFNTNFLALFTQNNIFKEIKQTILSQFFIDHSNLESSINSNFSAEDVYNSETSLRTWFQQSLYPALTGGRLASQILAAVSSAVASVSEQTTKQVYLDSILSNKHVPKSKIITLDNLYPFLLSQGIITVDRDIREKKINSLAPIFDTRSLSYHRKTHAGPNAYAGQETSENGEVVRRVAGSKLSLAEKLIKAFDNYLMNPNILNALLKREKYIDFSEFPGDFNVKGEPINSRTGGLHVHDVTQNVKGIYNGNALSIYNNGNYNKGQLLASFLGYKSTGTMTADKISLIIQTIQSVFGFSVTYNPTQVSHNSQPNYAPTEAQIACAVNQPRSPLTSPHIHHGPSTPHDSVTMKHLQTPHVGHVVHSGSQAPSPKPQHESFHVGFGTL